MTIIGRHLLKTIRIRIIAHDTSHVVHEKAFSIRLDGTGESRTRKLLSP